jgi:hypothetical protein
MPRFGECCCGRPVKRVLLPADLRKLSGKEHLLVHADNNDTQCYPDSNDRAERRMTAELTEDVEWEDGL